MGETITAIVLEAGNDVAKVVEKFDNSLGSLQEVVGGYVEAVRVNDSIVIWINEEGKLDGLPENFYLVDGTGKARDVIVGNAIITGSNEEGDAGSLSPEEIAEVKERFITRNLFKMF